MKTTKKRGSPRGVRLNSGQAVQRLLSRLVNQTLRGELETDVLRAVTYSCSMILKSLEVAELSDRLDRIERKFSL